MGADQNLDWQNAIASALDWWREAGVDMLVDELPRDWLQPVPAPAATASAAAPAALAPTRTPLPDSLDAFLAWRLGKDAPETRWSGTPFGPAGDATARLMVLVDQPEREDGESGQLLSGPAGRLFDRILAAIGQTRETIYLAAVATVRPATGRVLPEVAQELTELARHHVALVAPRRLLVLGDAASRAMLSTNVVEARDGLRALNLHVANKAVETQVVASFHPRFLLTNARCKAEAWRDLQRVIEGLQP